MRPGDVQGGTAPSAAVVLEVADGLRDHDPHLAAALVEHAVRLSGGDPSVRHTADLSAARALGGRDAPAELMIRYAPALAAAREEGRTADEAAWRVVLAGAALDLSDVGTARDLLADVVDDAVPGRDRPALAVVRARERAAAGDVEGCDTAARAADAGRTVTLDLLRARAAARASSGDVAGAIDLLATSTDDDARDAPTENVPASHDPALDVAGTRAPATGDSVGGRRAAGLAADHVALLLDRGDVRAALDRAAPFLEAAPGPGTAVAMGRLATDVARRVHLPAGDGERAMQLAARAESDLTARGQLAAAARAGLVLAEAAEAAGDLPRALSALRRAHAHQLDAREAEHAAAHALASVTRTGPRAVARPPENAPVAASAPAGLTASQVPGAGAESPDTGVAGFGFPVGPAATADPEDLEHGFERPDGGSRPARTVLPDTGGEATSGARGMSGDIATSGDTATSGKDGGSGGRRRRRDEEVGSPAAAGGRHGRPDDPFPGGGRGTDPAVAVPPHPQTVDAAGASPSAADALGGVPAPAWEERTAVARSPGAPDASLHVDPAPVGDVNADDGPGRSAGGGQTSALDTLRRNALRLEILLGRSGAAAPSKDGAGAPVGLASRGSRTSAPRTDGDGDRGDEASPSRDLDVRLTSATPSDPDDELPLTLVDLLAEYDLPDLRPAAARSTDRGGRGHGSAGPLSLSRRVTTARSTARKDDSTDEWGLLGRTPSRGSSDPFGDAPAPAAGVPVRAGAPETGWGDATSANDDDDDEGPGDRPGTDRTSTDLTDRPRVDGATARRDELGVGAETEPGARLADLLTEAMDAFRRAEPRASRSTSVPTGPADGRSPR